MGLDPRNVYQFLNVLTGPSISKKTFKMWTWFAKRFKVLFKRLRPTCQCFDTRLNVRARPSRAELKHLESVLRSVADWAQTLEQRLDVWQS